VDGSHVASGVGGGMDVEHGDVAAVRWRVEPPEDRPLDHLPVQPRPLSRVGALLDDEAQGHQVDADRLRGAPVGLPGVLDGVRIDLNLERHLPLGVGVRPGTDLAVRAPAPRRGQDVGMGRPVGGREQTAATAARGLWHSRAA